MQVRRSFPPNQSHLNLNGQATQLPSTIRGLFILFAMYSSVCLVSFLNPVISPSAFLLFPIALHVFLRPSEPWVRTFKGWITLALVIWVGVFLSAMFNGVISDGKNIEASGVISVVRHGYWLVVFIVTGYLMSKATISKQVVNFLAIGITITALCRWAEVILLGKIGVGQFTYVLSQNGYGILFSTFSAFLLVPVSTYGGPRRIAAILAMLIVLGAAAVNGSRTSWIAIQVGLILFVALYLRAHPHRIKGLSWVLVLVTIFVGAAFVAPERLASVVGARSETLGRVEGEKSFLIRELMIQKGWRLFRSSPVLGVGTDRFPKSSVPLDIPQPLTYAKQSHFDNYSAHNSYMLMLAETGLLGSVPYAMLLLILLIRGYRATIALAREGQTWAIGCYVSFVMMGIHLTTLAGITSTGPWMIYGTVVGVIMVEKLGRANRQCELSRLSNDARRFSWGALRCPLNQVRS